MTDRQDDELAAESSAPGHGGAIPWMHTDLGELVGGLVVCGVVAAVVALSRKYPVALPIAYVVAVALVTRWLGNSGYGEATPRSSWVIAAIASTAGVPIMWFIARLFCGC